MITVYNSFTRSKEEFVPREEGRVSVYVCGPTVYDVPHLGHGRSATAFDVIRRYFLYKGFSVQYVSNYTDIDDKMIVRAREEGISVAELAEKVIPAYEEDYGRLGIVPPDLQPRATDYVEEMVTLIARLEQQGYTYVLDDGVYFDVSHFPAYGGLSGQNLEELRAGARVEIKEEKRTPCDFVLWKFRKEGEPFWASPWGEGRPGWHIECSAMTWALLGESFDIHAGGLDLTFPHHECEIAQSQGVFGEKSFAQYWLHNAFITVDDEKMSKSLGNFFTLREIFEKFPPLVVRFMFLQTHYRNPINFSQVLLEQAQAGLTRLHDFVRNLRVSYDALSPGERQLKVDEYEMRFTEMMDNDFDTSGALGVIFELVNEIYSLRDTGKLTREDAEGLMAFLKRVDGVLGVIFPVETEELDKELLAMIAKREEARKNKDFATSDRIRDELLSRGVVLEDAPSGTVWKRRVG